jgi:molecular chaperone DnaK
MRSIASVGIDLGTTHTVVAVANSSGHTAMLRTREGELLIPSVVLVGDQRTAVGREARLRGRMLPDRLAACAKRQLGQPYYDQKIGGESLPPEVIQACLLQGVKREWFTGGDCAAVVAVPAHFNESQRHAAATAVEMSGISLLDLVNEPIAAALAFAECTPTLAPLPQAGRPTVVLVYDLGGYTFEATLLSIGPGRVSMIATEHDSFLGGYDWDMRLADCLAEPFVRQHGIDPRSDPALLESLVQQACQLKLALGVRSKAACTLALQGHSEKVVITRQQFEGMTVDLVERTLEICQNVLRQGMLTWGDLQDVLLVGGATRMPLVRAALAGRTGQQPNDRVSADEAVARGAAIYAARIKQGLAPPALRVTSISTHSVGIEGTDQRTGEHVNKVLIPKGTPLPTTATREFMAKPQPGQLMAFNVLEGEQPQAAKCVRIGRIVLRDLPADLADQWPVEVKCEYSASGQLSIDARVRYTDRQVHLETVRLGGVSQAHVARWKEVVTAQAGLEAYRRVRAWERAADATPPLVVAGLPPRPAPSPAEPPPEVPAPACDRSFIERLLPYVFRRRAPAAEASALASEASLPAPAAASSSIKDPSVNP